MSGSSKLTSDVDIDISGLLAGIARRKWLLLLVTLISAALFFAVFSTVPNRYKSTSSLILEQRESALTRINSANSPAGGTSFDAVTVGTQVQIMNSDDLVFEVIRELGLVRDAEFGGKGKSSSSITGILGGLLGSDSSQQSTSTSNNGEPNEGERRVLGEFRKRLQIYATPNTHVINITFWANRRELARDVVNLIAEKYLLRNRSAKSASTEEATKWLGPLINDMQIKLSKSEQEMEEFRASNDIFTGANNASLATQQLSEFSTELSNVRARRSSAEAKVQSIRASLNNGESVDVIPEVISSTLIQRLRERQAALEAEITQLSTTLLPNHPRIKAASSQLAGYNTQIKNAAKNILKSLENDVGLRQSQEKTLIQDINRLKSEASRVGAKQVKLRELERKVASDREALQRYQNQFIQAESRGANKYNPVDAVINQRGTSAFKAYFPKVIPFTAAGAFAVLLLTVIGFLAADLLSGRAFKSASTTPTPTTDEDFAPEEDGAYVKVTGAAASTRKIVKDAPPIVPAQNDLLIDDLHVPTVTTINAQSDQIAYNLEIAEQAIAELGKAEIAIVSPGGDAGSQAAWHISRKLSKNNKTVAVVDLTGTGATTSAMLLTKSVSGLGEVLSGTMQLRDVMFKDSQSEVHVLGAGQLTNDSLSNNMERLSQVSNVLCDTYDFVLYDCGPIGVNGLSKIAGPETVVVIPTLGSNINDCISLEQGMHENGYVEAIVIDFEGTTTGLPIEEKNKAV